MNEDTLNHIMDSLLQVYSVSNHQPQNTDQPDVGMTVIVILTLVLIVGSPIFLFFRNRRIKNTWEKGIIPLSFKPTNENIFEIFLVAGACMVARDRANNGKAFMYIKTYLNNRFPNEYYDLRDSYRYSLKHVVKIDSLATWCNKHLNSGKKIQLVNFLAGVAFYTEGFISEPEKQYLLALLSKLHLKYENLESSFRENMEEKKEFRPKFNAISRHYQVLGVPETVTLEELKTVYRQLVKKTHPDRFMNESEKVRQLKKEEFQRIQESYELILKEKQ